MTFSYRNIKKTTKSPEWMRFILYMLYAIVSPFLLNIFQLFSDILKSIDGKKISWIFMLINVDVLINVHSLYSIIFNFYRFIGKFPFNSVDPDKVDELEVAGFICTTFTINVIFFILTAFTIFQVKTEMYKLTSQEDSSRHLAQFNTVQGMWVIRNAICNSNGWFNMLFTEHEFILSFKMYLRLFIVMGMTYSISAISYLITRHSIVSEWTEIILSLQGVWIFILFVLKPHVFRLMTQRFV